MIRNCNALSLIACEKKGLRVAERASASAISSQIRPAIICAQTSLHCLPLPVTCRGTCSFNAEVSRNFCISCSSRLHHGKHSWPTTAQPLTAHGFLQNMMSMLHQQYPKELMPQLFEASQGALVDMLNAFPNEPGALTVNLHTFVTGAALGIGPTRP